VSGIVNDDEKKPATTVKVKGREKIEDKEIRGRQRNSGREEAELGVEIDGG
jgi:hypothetical protein